HARPQPRPGALAGSGRRRRVLARAVPARAVPAQAARARDAGDGRPLLLLATDGVEGARGSRPRRLRPPSEQPPAPAIRLRALLRTARMGRTGRPGRGGTAPVISIPLSERSVSMSVSNTRDAAHEAARAQEAALLKTEAVLRILKGRTTVEQEATRLQVDTRLVADWLESTFRAIWYASEQHRDGPLDG